MTRTLQNLIEKYIEGTKPKQYIKVFNFLISHLTSKVKRSIKIKSSKVYITSKALKHIYDRHCYDKNQNDVFNTIINNLPDIIKNPDIIRNNKEGKKGQLYLLKK
ncbi:MAG TPA: hypothetical protein PLS49_04535 [Candidatus Woesebacteria bacterium]|nr:hypothetical protein [Candidatus Woesebacteria bacterium]